MPALGHDQAPPAVEERAGPINEKNRQPEEVRAMAVHPNGKQRGQAPQPAPAMASGFEQQKLDHEKDVADEQRTDGQADRREEPCTQSPEESDEGVFRNAI